MDRLDILDHVRTLAETIVAGLGRDTDLRCRVKDVGFAPGGTDHVRVMIKAGKHRGYAHCPAHMPEQRAVVEVASQLQDAVIDAAWIDAQWGAAVPTCPGHPHPLSAEIVGGEPMWCCPRDPAHHSRPILAGS